MIASTDFTIPFVLICLVALVWWITRQIRTYNVSASPARPDRHLPADEYRLLGDDWTERVTEFRSEQFIRATRRRFAVLAVTGADPDKEMAPATAERPGATTSKEVNHAGKHI